MKKAGPDIQLWAPEISEVGKKRGKREKGEGKGVTRKGIWNPGEGGLWKTQEVFHGAGSGQAYHVLLRNSRQSVAAAGDPDTSGFTGIV